MAPMTEPITDTPAAPASAVRSPSGPDRLRQVRLVPEDWPWALRAGIECVALGWLVVVVPTVAVYLATSSLDAAAALSITTAASQGTGLWLLGLGGAMGSPSGADGVLSLPLLGLTALQAWWTWALVGRARLGGPLSVAWATGSATLTAVLASLTAPAGSRAWTAVLGSAILTAAVASVRVHRQGATWETAQRWWDRRPGWADEALTLAWVVTRAVAVLVVVVVAIALVTGAGRVSRLHDVLATGSIISTLGLVLLQLGWAPTFLIWALSWLVGPGFTVGTGSVFAPDAVVPGAVPGLPVLGALPTATVGGVGLYLPLVLTLVGLAAAWRRRSGLRELPVGGAMAAAAVAALTVASGCALLCLAASGSIGPGRMAHVGPRTGYVVLLVLIEVGAGLLAGTGLLHPWTRRRTADAVGVASQAAGTAAARTAAGARTRVGEVRAKVSAARTESGRDDETGVEDGADDGDADHGRDDGGEEDGAS